MIKNNLLKHRTGVMFVFVLFALLLSVSVTFSFFTDNTRGNINFSTVSAVEYDYTLSGSINNGIEATIDSFDDDVLLMVHEENLEDRALFSQVTITASWKGANDIQSVRFTDSITGKNLLPVIDTNQKTLTLTLPANKISANGTLTHKLNVLLAEDIDKDTLDFNITSQASSVKDSWAESVGPVKLKLHTNIKKPIKLEVAAASGHRTAYAIGDDFDSTNLVLTVTYDDNSTATIVYNQSKGYMIDKDLDGTYEDVLTVPDEFNLTNHSNLAQIIIANNGTLSTGVYPHAAYTEKGTTVECDIIVTVGNRIFQEASVISAGEGTEIAYKNPILDYYSNSLDTVIFMQEYNLPDGFNATAGNGPWDISRDKDQSVMAYVIDNGFTKEMRICANVGTAKPVLAPEYADGLFERLDVRTSLDVTNLDVSNTKYMRQTFDRLPLTEITGLASWDVSNVTDMRLMFYYSDIKSLSGITGWNVSNVQSTSYMFDGCTSLEAIDISKWNCASITSNLNMFFGCEKLMQLTIPASMHILNPGFAGRCEKLTDFTFLHTKTDSLVFVSSSVAYARAPYSADNLLKTYVHTSNQTIKDIVYSYTWKTDNRTLLFDVTFQQTEGGTLSGDITNQQEWAEDLLSMSVNATPDDGYKLEAYEIRYTVNGTGYITETQDLSTFEMPWAEITVTPVWKIDKIPVKLEVSVEPDETYYIPGEDYDPTGVEFTVTYDDNSTATIIYNVSKDAYYIDKHNGKGYVLLDDTDFVMTHIKNLVETYFYTPAADYTKGGTGTDYNGDPFTFTYNESTGYYEVTYEDAGPYSYTESTFFNYFVNSSDYTVIPNDTPSETLIGTFPHAAYTENGVTVECDVIITVAAPVLKNTYGYLQSTVSLLDNTDLLSYLDSDSITSIEFKDSFEGLDRQTMDYADVSDKQNGSVIAWVDGNTIYVGGKKGVYANTNITGLFSDTFRNGSNHYYDDITSIDVTHLKVVGENSNGYPVTTDMAQVFYGCDALTTIIGLEHWNTSSVTTMSGMFGRTSICKITGVSNWDTSNVISMGSMFDEDQYLTDVSELAKWDTSNVKSTRYMFSECSSLTSVPIDNWDFSSIVGDWQYNSDSMFEDCILLEELTIPATMKALGNSFAMGCSSLDTITFLHDSDDELVIEDPGYLYGAFYVSTSADGSIKYWNNPLVTNIHLPNDSTGALKEFLSTREWADDNRTPSFGTATLSLDLNGGDVMF